MFKRFFRLIKIAFSTEKALYFYLKQIFGVYPDNLDYYKIAFIHRSASKQLKGITLNNERLEYLGDAILGAIVSDYLFTNYPHYKEGQLTQIRSKLVNYNSLSQIAHHLDINNYIISQPNVQDNSKYLFGDMMEALIGALYLDKGFIITKKVVLNRLLKKYLEIDKLSNNETDFKSRVIEQCQKLKYTITFTCKEKSSITDNSKIFQAFIIINGELAGTGLGSSKKEAEQHAAHNVWKNNSLFKQI